MLPIIRKTAFISSIVLIGLIGGFSSPGQAHNFKDIESYSYSKFMMEVKFDSQLDQCIGFSIRVMHHLAEYQEVYAKMSKHTPNIDNEAYHLLKTMQNPDSQLDTSGLSRVIKTKLTNFIDNCIELLSPPPIEEDAEVEINEFSLIPGFILSKARMEVRDMQPVNRCVNFSIKLMHFLADRKPAYQLISVYTPNIETISFEVILKLKPPGGIKTDDLTPKFKNDILGFIAQCETDLAPRVNQ